jgi:DNA-binding response OmpR family regulator
MMTVPHETVTPNLLEKLSDSRTTRVLVVDDEFSARNVLAAILAKRAFACKTTATGEAALDILEKELVHAVISDLRMPGISGLELLTEVR